MRTVVLVVAFLAACAKPAPTPPVRGDWPGWQRSERTRVILLGTGTPNAVPARSGPATVILVDDVPYLVDAGPGVVRRAAAAGIRVATLKRAFLTHLHSDHTLGLNDLIFTPWVLERDTPLQLFGPEGTAAMVDHLSQAYRQDIRMRIDGLEPANEVGYTVEVDEIETGVVYQDKRVTVTAIAVEHGSWKQAYGFKFVTPDRTIVLSGDCRPSPALVEASRGADLLIHEVYSHARFQKRAPVWQRYHSSFHTSTLELAKIAAEARPRLLVLTHQLFWGATEQDLLDEIATGYDGPVVSGRDLDDF